MTLPDRFIGIDVSLANTGVAVVDIKHNSYNIYSVKTSPKMSDIDRMAIMVSGVTARANIRAGDMVCFEDFTIALRGRPDGRFTTRVEFQGAIKYELYALGAKILLCHPMTMKKFVTGNGSADKKVVREILERKGYKIGNYDEADALGLALIVSYWFHPNFSGPISTPQRVALKKFEGYNKDVLSSYIN